MLCINNWSFLSRALLLVIFCTLRKSKVCSRQWERYNRTENALWARNVSRNKAVHIKLYWCLLAFIYAYLYLFMLISIYLCLFLFIYVYLYLLMFICIYLCFFLFILFMFIQFYLWLCLFIFMYVYACLLIFMSIYAYLWYRKAGF